MRVTVNDTVGAGDVFTAAIIAGMLRHDRLESLHARAVEVAGYVCSQAGATPKIPVELAR